MAKTETPSFDERMAEAKAADLQASWQIHRYRCLEIAASLGARTDNAIEIADKLSLYVLNGTPRP